MLVAVLDIGVERNVLSFLIQLEFGSGGETLGEGGFAVKLVRELSRVEHGLRVGAGRLRKSGIEAQRRRSRLLARLIRQLQEMLFCLGLGIEKRNVGGRGRLHRGGFRGLRGRGRVGRRHQPRRRLDRGESRGEQERQQ